MTEQIILTMPIKNGAKTVEKSIASFLQQKGIKREKLLLIANDSSTDNSFSIIENFLPNPSIVLLNVNYGSAYGVRNFLNHYVRQHYPNCVLIGRLDADDTLIDTHILSKIEQLYDTTGFDVLMCGNKQLKNNQIQKWINKADKRFLEEEYLLNRLYQMSIGDKTAELPSCNTFIKPNVAINYPKVRSAEDHWFTVYLLLQKNRLNILIEEELLYCIYSLDGTVTNNNKKANYYKKSRIDLYHFYKKQLEQ